MKKFTFALMLAAVMLFAAAPLFAEGMTFGVKAGLNMANLSGDDITDTSMKIGMLGGAFLCYNITEIFAVQPEALFAMKGAKASEGEGKWSVNYIEIPVLLKVNMPTEGKIKPFLAVGPGIGILMTSKQSEGSGEDVDVKDYTKSTNFGIIAGAGIAYQMEGGALSLEARYEIGLQSIAKNAEGDDAATEPDIKTSDISILVGYGFAF